MRMADARRAIVKWVVYVLLLLAVFAVQEYLFPALRIFGVAPIFMGTLAVCVGMCEGAAAGAVFGAVCGAMMYASSGSSELINMLVYAAGGAAAGVLCESILSRGLPGALLLSLAANAAATVLFFIFVMWIPGRAGVSALVTVGAVEAVYSTAGVLFIWPAARGISLAANPGAEE